MSEVSIRFVAAIVICLIFLAIFFRLTLFFLGLILTREVAVIAVGNVIAVIIWIIVVLPFRLIAVLFRSSRR